MTTATWSIVIPSLYRASLQALLESLEHCSVERATLPMSVVIVDDRHDDHVQQTAPPARAAGWVAGRLVPLRSGGRGPAAARNVGWRAVDSEWVVFLDDDVLVTPGWLGDLCADLAAADPATVAVQGRIEVPLPADRRPTDCERNTAGLETAVWITADMAVRTAALRRVDGFDERFPRAFREDADLALRLQDHGGRLSRGTRATIHPARAGNWALSVRQQKGIADDVLMSRLHGRTWWARAQAPRGRRRLHLSTVVGAVVAALGAASGRRRTATAGLTTWAALTGAFAWRRIGPGPRDRAEVARMLVTSVLIPPVAVGHWLAALLTGPRRPAPWGSRVDGVCRAPSTDRAIDALLLDRDGTLIVDVPYNGDPDLVEVMPGVADALVRARAAGLRTAVVTNQSAVARGLIDLTQLAAVNARVEQLIGPFESWQFCPHDDADGCQCRKPRPGMLLAAAAALGVPIGRCAMIGDTVADVAAAHAAGTARAVLVPNPVTRAEEVSAADDVAIDFAAAVESILTGSAPTTNRVRAPDAARPGASEVAA